RADLVAPFESDLVRRQRNLLPAWQVRETERMFQIDLHPDPPCAEELLKLCADPELDYVVAPQEFPGLYAATNGTWFIYECRALRGPGVAQGTTPTRGPKPSRTDGSQRCPSPPNREKPSVWHVTRSHTATARWSAPCSQKSSCEASSP